MGDTLANLASISIGAVVTPSGTLSFAVFAELAGGSYTWPLGPSLTIPGLHTLSNLATGWFGAAEGGVPHALAQMGWTRHPQSGLYMRSPSGIVRA